MPDTISISIVLPVHRDKKALILDACSATLGAICLEDGCRDCRLREDARHRDRLVLVQNWRDAIALNKHVRGKNFASLLAAIGSLGAPPEVSVSQVRDQRTLMVIQDLFEKFRVLQMEPPGIN